MSLTARKDPTPTMTPTSNVSHAMIVPLEGPEGTQATEYTDEEFEEQRRIVIQLLKDWKLPYSTSRGSGSGADTISSVSTSGLAGGNWPLNAEVLGRQKDNDLANSHRLLADELEHMRMFSIYYRALEEIFLRDDAGDADYERLVAANQKRYDEIYATAEKMNKKGGDARRIVLFLRKHLTPQLRLYGDVEIAIHELTTRLMGKQLYATFAEQIVPEVEDGRTNRRKTMEQHYEDIYSVFCDWCRHHAERAKRYRNKAINDTVISCNVSRATVERAVHFIESTRDQEQEHS